MSVNVVSQVLVNTEKPIDREKICPLLLRVFCANVRHNPIHEYARGSVPANELQMYTWLDCTLRELTALIKEVNPDARRRGTTFDFSVVTPDRSYPKYHMREIGNTMNGQRGVDDNKTLSMCKFEIGDYIDVAITMPGAGHAGPRRYGGGFDGHRRDGFERNGGFDRDRNRGDGFERRGEGFDRDRRMSPSRK